MMEDNEMLVGDVNPVVTTYYNFKNHIARLDLDTSTADIEVYASIEGTDTLVFSGTVVGDQDDVAYVDVLPIMTSVRVEDYNTIVPFQIVSGETVFVSGVWTEGTKNATSYDSFVLPFRYISTRFSPAYSIPITGTSFNVNVDGEIEPSSLPYVHAAYFSPSTSFSANAVVFEKACEEYQFVYINAYGALVNYIPQGGCIKMNDFERSTYKPTPYSRLEYQNRVSTKYTFNTEYFNADESAVFVEDFLSSPYIVFYAPEYPLGIQIELTETTANYLTRQNVDGPMYHSFSFNISEATIHA